MLLIPLFIDCACHRRDVVAVVRGDKRRGEVERGSLFLAWTSRARRRLRGSLSTGMND